MEKASEHGTYLFSLTRINIYMKWQLRLVQLMLRHGVSVTKLVPLTGSVCGPYRTKYWHRSKWESCQRIEGLADAMHESFKGTQRFTYDLECTLLDACILVPLQFPSLPVYLACDSIDCEVDHLIFHLIYNAFLSSYRLRWNLWSTASNNQQLHTKSQTPAPESVER